MLRDHVTPFDKGKTFAKSVNLQRMQTVSKIATFFATESVYSAPFKRRETKVRNFGKEKCETFRHFSVLARKSAKFFANFSATT